LHGATFAAVFRWVSCWHARCIEPGCDDISPLEEEVKMTTYAMLGLTLLGALMLAGCGTAGEETGLANPASVYCEDAGHTLEIRRTDEGEYGICHFGDGEQCEEWAFFNGECGLERTFCATQGYTPERRDGKLVCVFPDGTSCLETDHVDGRCGR
jgi:putative hemolysin